METTSAITQDIVIPGAITQINQAALATVNRALPELQDKTKSYHNMLWCVRIAPRTAKYGKNDRAAQQDKSGPQAPTVV